ncbi:MAG: biotin/lipoyl-binding protein [Deltaproteobacteria bacterium]|nr:biotin/lipoyl-binding protein [Deltaproteobacteria bacterium]
MDIKLPQLAEGVESGTVVNILVSEGQEIKKDQAFMELETQKAVGSIPSPSTGTVSKVHVKEGMEVIVGQVLISIDTGAASKTSTSESTSSAANTVNLLKPLKSQQTAVDGAPTERHAENFHYESGSGVAPPAPPSVRKIALQLGIDLTRVRGSEAGGRIRLPDIRAYIQHLQEMAFQELGRSARPAGPVAAPAAPKETIDFSQWGPIRREKLSPLRRTVSRRMVESWTTIPKINQFDEADISALLVLRKRHTAAYEKKGTRLTLTAFILLVLARALRKHPSANASLDEAGGELILKDYCHIGVAVDTDAGLIVPILRDVDKKSLLQLSRELQDLTDKTRQRKIGIEELQGGTFTISNQGSIGGSHFTPIIYAPQVAILGVGQGQSKAVVVDGKLAIRTMLPLCLAYDHRVLDGANAVRFLRDMIAGLQSFDEADVKIK